MADLRVTSTARDSAADQQTRHCSGWALPLFIRVVTVTTTERGVLRGPYWEWIKRFALAVSCKSAAGQRRYTTNATL